MVVHDGIEVRVVVNGGDAVEYNNPEAQENALLAQGRVIKYIESIDGAPFEIQCKIHPEFCFEGNAVCLETWIDGNLEVKKTAQKDDHTIIMNGRLYYEQRQLKLKKFKFSTINIVEGAGEGTLEKDIKLTENLGKIVVKVKRCQSLPCTDSRQYSEWSSRRHGARTESEISEKTLKGNPLSHQTSFGEATSVEDNNRWVSLIYVEQEPLEFEFWYRSKGLLMSQMIISTEASLEPATSDARPQVNIDELSVDQLRKLVSKQSAQLAQFHYNEDAQLVKPEPAIKRDRVHSPSLTPNCEAPQLKRRKIIDLTGDDDNSSGSGGI